MTPKEREYWLNAAKYGSPTDVYDRAAYPFTRNLAIPALGATIGPGREDYTGGGDPTRSPYIGSFATGRADGLYIYPQPLGSDLVKVLRSRSVSPPPLNSPLEEDPITVLRRNTDRARDYPRTFSEMFSPSLNPEGDIGRFVPNKPAVSRPKSPKSRPGMTIPQSSPMPAVPAKSAAPPPGLLDTEEEQPADSVSWYDDPMRMGLLQAGLGLMSAPRYSTNPNDVTLSSALARGLGGFVQGYGGTKKRLSEAERQKVEDEWKRSQMEKDIEYKDALIQMYGIQGEAQRKTADLNATEKQLQKQAVAAQVERILEYEGKQGNATRRLELTRLGSSNNTNQQNQFADLYRESVTDRTSMEETLVASGKYTEEEAKKLPFTALVAQYNKTLELKTNPPKTTTTGEADERMFNSLNKGKRGDIPLEDPEYVNAYTRYYEKYLRPKTNLDGSTLLPNSQFDAPPDFKTSAAMEDGNLVSTVNTAGGRLIKPMNQKDKDAVRNLTSNIAKLEEYETILNEIDINNLDRISQTSPELAKLQTVFKDLQLRLKDDPYALGALTGPDLGLMEAILSDPTKADITDWRAYLQKKPFYLAQANQLKKILAGQADSIYSDYGTSVEDQYQRQHKRPLTWLKPQPAGARLTAPETDAILSEIVPPSADAPVPNNGNESSLLEYLPDRIRNIFN